MRAGNDLAVAPREQRDDAPGVPFERVQQLAVLDLPDAQQLIIARRDQKFAVRAEDERADRAAAVPGANEFAVIAIPHADRAIAAGRSQPRVVRGKRQGVDFIGVPLERRYYLAG